MSIIDFLTSLYAPDECLSCRREGRLLCDRCARTMSSTPGYCYGCYAPAAGVACQQCLIMSGCTSMVAVAHYAGVAKQLVASLKFRGSQSAASVMAAQMGVLCPALSRGTLITHVPATAAHIRQRGYDQGALLARHFARLVNGEAVGALARSGNKHQLGAGRGDRLKQLANSLRVKRPASIQGRNIVLIDDVLTTGSSVQAAAKVLLQAGAQRVDVVVFAQAIDTPPTMKAMITTSDI